MDSHSTTLLITATCSFIIGFAIGRLLRKYVSRGFVSTLPLSILFLSVLSILLLFVLSSSKDRKLCLYNIYYRGRWFDIRAMSCSYNADEDKLYYYKNLHYKCRVNETEEDCIKNYLESTNN